MFQNVEIIPWISWLRGSGGNESYELPKEAMQSEKIRSQVKYRVLEKLCETLWVCVENPRNDIDNPVRYCTQPLYTAILTFMAANLKANLSRKEDVSWNQFFRLEERLNSGLKIDINVFLSWGRWLHHEEKPIAEYCISAYMAGKISAEKAIELSGLDQIDFASKVRERTQEKHLPIFRAYLRGETVEEQLPFSEEVSIKFKDLMAEEIE